MALAPGTPPVAPPVPRVPPALACEDWPRWRRFRQRFARWARPSRRGERPLGRPGGRLVAEAKDLVRNASEGEFTRSWLKLLRHLSGSSEMPEDTCLFGEVAAQQVLLLSTEALLWQAQVALQTKDLRYVMHDSGWPVFSPLDLSLEEPRPVVPRHPSAFGTFGRDLGRPPLPGGVAPSSVQIVLVGSHSSQLRQTGQMIQEIADSRALQVHLNYAGCVYVPYACVKLGSDMSSLLYHSLARGDADPTAIREGLEAAKIGSYGLAVVLDMGLSSLLRSISQVPILHVIGIYPLTLNDELGRAIPEELRQSLEDSSIYSLATSTVCALQLWWISGRRLPVITPLPEVKPIYQGGQGEVKRRRILQWRGDVLWNTVAGSVFWVWVQMLLHLNSGIDIVRITHGVGTHMSWKEVGRHDAVLFVPEDLTKIGFWDLYASAMPLFITDESLTASLLCPEPMSRVKMHYFDTHWRLPFFETGAFEALEPFDLERSCERKLEFWGSYADFYHFPHVMIFASGIDLVLQVLSADLLAVSQAMAHWALLARQRSMRHFHHALAQVYPIFNQSTSA
ncbi:unnamed protein product [Durusdinium trenchii]|uniref:Uncharacterized protein n=1 Tax=Durusdinium trenchii TaxID=1381693 RepID=A0ABP0RRN4_9DINO